MALGIRQYGERLTSERARRLLDAVGVAGTPRADQDATLGELLYLAGMRYYQRVHDSVEKLADSVHAHVTEGVSNALLTANGATLYLFDRPFAVNPRGMTLDAKKDLGFWLRTIEGNEPRLDEILRICSMSSSALEHLTLGRDRQRGRDLDDQGAPVRGRTAYPAPDDQPGQPQPVAAAAHPALLCHSVHHRRA